MSCAQERQKISRMKSIAYTFALVYVHRSFRFRVISLKLFDKENIPAATIRKIRDKYVTNPDFHPSLIKNVSSACEGLCSWVRAIEVYDRVAKVTSITPFVISCFVKSEFMIHTYQSYYVLTL